MPRSLVLGNGKTLVGLDRYAQVRDFYFPFVGLENHVRGHYVHKIGVFVDGRISWFAEDGGWQIEVMSSDRALVGSIEAVHDGIGVKMHFEDIVYNEDTIFFRKISVTNTAREAREIKVFFGQQFEISKSHAADTAYFDPLRHAVVHYKGQRVFLINGECDGMPFSEYTVGLTGFQGHEGSYRDADDGVLSKNPIEHGPVDSVIGFYNHYESGEAKVIYYWIAVGSSVREAGQLNDEVMRKTPEHMVRTATDYWSAWVLKYEWSFKELSDQVISLFRRSLMIVRAHVDDGGAIIASSDSDMLNQGKDTYAYMWPRDAGFSAIALDRAGDANVAKRFFEFSRKLISEEGYFMHKYLPDGSLGSSWHPWIRNGVVQLPIQEDETALVLWSLYEHYQHSRDIEFIESLFNPVIEKAANFMMNYRDKVTGLPKGSYDLWEEKYGTSTYTACAVYGGLTAAAEFSRILGKVHHEKNYRDAADEVKQGILHYLFDKDKGYFVKLISGSGKEMTYDTTLDISSAYGIFLFGVLPISDERLQKAYAISAQQLSRNSTVGGVARYEGDNYYRVPGDTAGNPWFITTLWVTQYDIARAQTEKDFEKIRGTLDWVAAHALKSGILSEQLNPHTGEQVSAAPLTWSHAEYVTTVLAYLTRLEELGICKACNPVP